jgi:hypothetical protein
LKKKETEVRTLRRIAAGFEKKENGSAEIAAGFEKKENGSEEDCSWF